MVASTGLPIYFPLIPKSLSKTFVGAASKHLSCVVHGLLQPIDRRLEVCLLALRAAARSSEAFPLFKPISTRHTPERQHRERSVACCCRQRNVRKMLVDLFLPNADGLRDLSGRHVLVLQEENHLLAYGLRTAFAAHALPSGKGVLPSPSLANLYCSHSLTIGL